MPHREEFAALHGAIARRDWRGARAECERLLERTPEDADALHGLGVVQWAEGDAEGAIEYLSAAIAREPRALWWNNLGVLYTTLRRPGDAVSALRRSLELDPTASDTEVHLAMALCDSGKAAEAIEICRRVLDANPGHVGALTTLGRAHRMRGQPLEACSVLTRAAGLAPNSAGIQIHLADVSLALRRVQEAHGYALRATELAPSAESFCLLAVTAWETGQHQLALQARDTAFTFGIPDPALHSALLLLSLYDPDETAESISRSHRLWAITHCARCSEPVFPNVAAPQRKLRIGFVAAGLYSTPAVRFRLPLIRMLDRESFDVFVYLLSPEPGAEDQHHHTAWRCLHGQPDEAAAEAIRADAIDVLVDCSGHQSNGRMRIFGFRPAPVQVVYSGYPATTGLTCMDAFFTDSVLTPEGAEAAYSEPVVRLPGGRFLYQPPAAAPEVASLPALRNGFVTFGVFQKAAKLNEPFLRKTAEVMNAVPGSSVLFHHEDPAFDDPVSPTVQRIRSVFQAEAISADKVQFTGPRHGADHFISVGSADIALDSTPYNGHATTCECLWMGVPVVTMLGKTFAGRVSASLMSRVGLGELCGASEKEYTEIAVSLAQNLSMLADLRTGLRERMASSGLTDVPARVLEFEQAVRMLWRAWCSRQRGAKEL